MRLMTNIGGMLILFSIIIAIFLGFFIIVGVIISRPLSPNELSLLSEIWSYCWKLFVFGISFIIPIFFKI